MYSLDPTDTRPRALVSVLEKHQPPSRHERGTVGVRLKPAAAIVRQYGEQF